MTALATALSSALVLVSAAQDPPIPHGDAAAGQVLFDIQLIQIDIDTASNEAISFGGEFLEFHVTQGGRSPIVIGAEDSIEVGDRTWPLDRPQKPLEDAEGASPITVLSAPRILCNFGQTASLAIGEKIHYLEKDDDGRLVVRTDEDSFEGIRLSVEPEETDDGNVSVKRVRATLSVMSGREELEGVPLDVGRPIVGSVGISGSFTLPPGQTALIPMPTWDKDLDPILIVIRAKRLNE